MPGFLLKVCSILYYRDMKLCYFLCRLRTCCQTMRMQSRTLPRSHHHLILPTNFDRQDDCNCIYLINFVESCIVVLFIDSQNLNIIVGRDQPLFLTQRQFSLSSFYMKVINKLIIERVVLKGLWRPIGEFLW